MQNPFEINPIKHFQFEGQTWTAKIPNPKEGRLIDVEVSKRLNGASIDSLPIQTYNYTSMCVTLNFVLKEVPYEYKQVRDWEEYPDMKFVIDLYAEYDKQNELFYKELEELKKNRLSNGRNSGGGLSASQVQSNTGSVSNVSPTENSGYAVSDASGSDSNGASLQTNRTFERVGKVESVTNPSQRYGG
jgi:hypothetical protein